MKVASRNKPHLPTINVRDTDGLQVDMQVYNHVFVGDCYGLKFLSKHIQPETILDVGGHIGTFGLLAKYYWPDAKLVAIEPNKESYELYKKNLARYSGVTVIHGAVSYNPQRNILAEPFVWDNGNLIKKQTGGGATICDGETIKREGNIYKVTYKDIPTYTVEDLLKYTGNVDLAKWDCEGAEVEAFQEMESHKSFNYMIGEFHISKSKRLEATHKQIMNTLYEMFRKFNHLIFGMVWGEHQQHSPANEKIRGQGQFVAMPSNKKKLLKEYCEDAVKNDLEQNK